MSKQQQNFKLPEEDASYAHLPVQFNYQNEDGGIDPVTDPVYRCLADGFYGRRMGASHFQEGEIIVLNDTPNQHLQPLNRAAGKKIADWLASLPASGVQIGIGDLMEAATMLRPRDGVPELPHEEYSKALQNLALQLKAKREGRSDLYIPPINAPNTGNKSKLPGMLGAHYTDPSRRGPGDVGQPTALHEPAPVERIRRGKPAMSGIPAPAPGPA